MSECWSNLKFDGRRLARLIKFLETKLKKVKDDDDAIVRYASTIGNLISKKIEVIKAHKIDARLEALEKIIEERKQ